MDGKRWEGMEEEAGESYIVEDDAPRLDKWLAEVSGLSRSRIQKLIEDGGVLLDGQAVSGKTALKQGQRVSLMLPEPVPLSLEPEDIPLDIVYQDEDIVIVNKQKGLVVHPAAGNWTGTMVQALLFHCRDLGVIAGSIRPGIVHRLDKDTTGLMVVAKHEAAMQQLSEQIKARSMERHYTALVWGGFREAHGLIDAPIGRHPRDRKRMAVVSSGREARTEYRVMAELGRWTLLHLKLQTGRTHQIRVHLSHIGHPIVGDPVYLPRENPFGLKTQALHAYRLCLQHPSTEERRCWQCAPPNELLDVLKDLGCQLYDN